MSLAREGNTDLYEMNLKSMNLSRLTKFKGIDTAPSYFQMVKTLSLNLIEVEGSKFIL